MAGRLEGKVAIITGASEGIGFATAKRFLEEGASVTICARREEVLKKAEDELREISDHVAAELLDVSDTDGFVALVKNVAEREGRLDILVNNATSNAGGEIVRTSLEKWKANFAVNADATFIGTRQAMRIMLPQRNGSIVNIASSNGLMAMAGSAGYGAAKAALIHLSKIAAMEGADQNVRVNVVAPGYVDTPASRAAVQGNEAIAKAVAQGVPAKRAGTAEEIASAILFLASDESSYVTGAVLPVDGGKVAELYVPELDLNQFSRG